MAKQHYCFLERFNNYFNRKIIKYDALSDYEEKAENYFIPVDANGNMTPFDFNPNDNITTEIIANGVPFDPDYFLLLDDDENIVSRWFVLEQKRNRQGQWLYFLRRDVLADSYEELNNAPLYVERGIINDYASPLLLNNEDLRVNQIKKREILLKDKTNCAWLVLYLKKGVLGNDHIGPDNNGKITINIPKNETFVYEELTTPIAQWQYFPYSQGSTYKVANSHTFSVAFNVLLASYQYSILNADNNTLGRFSAFNWDTNLSWGGHNESVYKALLNAQFVPNLSSLNSLANSSFGYNSSDNLSQYEGKIIKDSAGKYFKVTLAKISSEVNQKVTSLQSSLKALMTNCWNNATGHSDSPNDKCLTVRTNATLITVILDELTDLQTSVDVGAYTGHGTTDSALFDAVCLPYGDLDMFIGTEVSVDTHATADKSLKIMNSLATALTSENVLDLQILPYCPCQNLVNNDYFQEGGIYVPEDDADEVIEALYSGNVTDFLLVCHSMNITLDIEQAISISVSDDVPETYKTKYINDCTLLRLCSPNYNGLFDMRRSRTCP